MTEASYPAPINISEEAIAKLSVVEELTLEPSDVKDMRPTQEFRNVVDNVIKSREVKFTRDKQPLTQAIDEALANAGITR